PVRIAVVADVVAAPQLGGELSGRGVEVTPMPPTRTRLVPYPTLVRSRRPRHSLYRRATKCQPLEGRDESTGAAAARTGAHGTRRSEEHTSELPSRFELVCRLRLEKKYEGRRRWRRGLMRKLIGLGVVV